MDTVQVTIQSITWFDSLGLLLVVFNLDGLVGFRWIWVFLLVTYVLKSLSSDIIALRELHSYTL